MNIYQIQHEGVAVFVVALNQTSAVTKWRLDGEFAIDVDPDSINLIAEGNDVII